MMKKIRKILLIYPEIPPTYWSFKYALPFIKKKASIPPLGLLTVAAMLPPTYTAKLIDMNVTALSDEAIAQADMVFTSSMIVQKNSLAQLGERCRKLQIPHIAGGPYPSSSYEKIKNVDHFVLNEAEVTMPQFLQDLEKGQLKPIYQDFRKADITTTPAPRFDLLSMDDYTTMPLQYSRGCPFQCEFCDIIEMFGRKMRTKTNRQLINELTLLYSLGWKGSVFIVDDNFIGHKKNIKKLLPAIYQWQKERNYPFDLFTEASINLAEDEKLLDMMSSAGFNMVFIGIETPDKDTLINTGKKQNVKQDLYQSIITIQNKGIEVTGGFIVGFDTDSPNIFQRQIRFIQQSGIALAMVGLLTALPNTQLYRRLKEEGRLLEDSTGNNTHDLQINFQPKMDLSVIIEGYKQIIKQIYSPKTYFDRCLIFLHNLHPHQNSSRRVRKQEILAFFRSLIKQSFSFYGHHYLRFLIKALTIEPKMFPEAVRQAIMGHHFFKITEEILAVDDFKSYAERIKDLYQEKIKNACAYQERIKNAYTSFDMEQKITELKIAKEKFIRDMQREYKKIDRDFRHLVEEYLSAIETSLNVCYSQWLENLTYA